MGRPSTRAHQHFFLFCNNGKNGQALTDILASLDPSESNESLAGLVQCLGDGERGLGFTLGPDDGGLTLLLGLC
jgi:hypothetical protein